MTRNERLIEVINRLEVRHNRFLNDTWIFVEEARPNLKIKANELRRDDSKRKKEFDVPRDGKDTFVTRTSKEISEIYLAQHDRGVFESNIIGIVSRTEAFIQECLIAVIREYPKKLSVIAGGSGIPIDLFLEHEDREALLERFIAGRCQGLMFGKPTDYLDAAAKVLGIENDPNIVDDYIEIKASRDIIVHNSGAINRLYVDKAGPKRRGKTGEALKVDYQYFRSVIEVVKRLSRHISDSVEVTYGPQPKK